MQRFPVDVEVEFRGVSDAREGKPNRETGEVRTYRDLKFERLVGDADISVIEVAAGEFDYCKPAFDWTKLQRGDQVRLRGDVVLAGRFDRDDQGRPMRSYFTIAGGQVEVVGKGASLKAA